MSLERPLALFILTVATSAVCQPPKARNAIVPLCDLIKDSANYSGRNVTTTARVSAGRHVTVIWDPACRGAGATLEFEKSSESVAGVRQLEAELDKAGVGDHPLIATLSGIWVGTKRTDNGFIAQPRIVFRVTDASNITRSAKVERF
jgi:hypothetical protein